MIAKERSTSAGELLRLQKSLKTLRKRFEREAQATAALESLHTVELYDFGVTDEGVFYYVMEMLKGKDLKSMVQQHGSLPPERVI
ncbi:hypothetical protein MYX82_10990 [Acidobacteria bacterium AH-259-D05]|nr:hypothetical protein [Acidobacteria bacterium AH-259-D05]